MFAIAARRMGYRVHTLSPDDDTPTGQVADREVQAAYDDLDAVRDFARGVDVVTFEFENVSAAAAEAAAEHAPVRPAGAVLHTTQNRLREKRFLCRRGLPGGALRGGPLAWRSCEAGLARDRHPGGAQDGRLGLRRQGAGEDRRRPEEAAAAWEAVGGQECDAGGVRRFRPRGLGGGRPRARRLLRPLRGDREPAQPEPHPGRLDRAGRRFRPPVERDAVEIARGILEGLEVVGVLCVEIFLTRDGRLLVNELAPRPHNSGHLTFDACVTSQFEQQLRAICGLALGSTELLRPAAMANLLGDLWEDGEPDWAAACPLPRGQAPPLRQGHGPAGTEDGAPDGAGRDAGGGAAAGGGGERSAH